MWQKQSLVQTGKQHSESHGPLSRSQCPSESDLELENTVTFFPSPSPNLLPTSGQGLFPRQRVNKLKTIL